METVMQNVHLGSAQRIVTSGLFVWIVLVVALGLLG
jgi:hypothetical protein